MALALFRQAKLSARNTLDARHAEINRVNGKLSTLSAAGAADLAEAQHKTDAAFSTLNGLESVLQLDLVQAKLGLQPSAPIEGTRANIKRARLAADEAGESLATAHTIHQHFQAQIAGLQTERTKLRQTVPELVDSVIDEQLADLAKDYISAEDRFSELDDEASILLLEKAQLREQLIEQTREGRYHGPIPAMVPTLERLNFRRPLHPAYQPIYDESDTAGQLRASKARYAVIEALLAKAGELVRKAGLGLAELWYGPAS